jgi:hypothetical protein
LVFCAGEATTRAIANWQYASLLKDSQLNARLVARSHTFCDPFYGSDVMIVSNGQPPFLADRASVGNRKATANLRGIGDRLAVGRFHALFMPIARTLILVTTIEREEQE